MKLSLAVTVALFCLLLAPAAVKADAQEDQNACMVDAQTHCGQFIPDRERVAHCLMANRSRISAECRRALRHFK
jgi:hypothetical protein